MKKILVLTLLFSLVFSAIGYASSNDGTDSTRPLVMKIGQTDGFSSNEYFNIQQVVMI